MKKTILKAISAYQRFLSPLSAPKCKYYPSCSQYAKDCFSKFSLPKAFVLSFWRLLRCNPFSNGGVDFATSAQDPR